MTSLADLLNPTFLMFLGILVLAIALIVVYFESKMREQNHKIASMLSLVSTLAEDMNGLKMGVNQFAIRGGNNSNISIKDNLDNSILDNLPTSLKFLKIESILLDSQKDNINIFSNLPRGLEKLLIVIYPYNLNYIEPIIQLQNLPESLIELVIFSKFKYTLDKEYLQITIHHFENRIVDENNNYNMKYLQFDELFF